jgi:hypothetical protein
MLPSQRLDRNHAFQFKYCSQAFRRTADTNADQFRFAAHQREEHMGGGILLWLLGIPIPIIIILLLLFH